MCDDWGVEVLVYTTNSTLCTSGMDETVFIRCKHVGEAPRAKPDEKRETSTHGIRSTCCGSCGSCCGVRCPRAAPVIRGSDFTFHLKYICFGDRELVRGSYDTAFCRSGLTPLREASNRDRLAPRRRGVTYYR